jgi:DoxX-like family
MSALPVLMVLMGSVMKLMRLPGVVEGFARAGAPEKLIFPVGLIELICCVVYVIPRTSVLGAILMTGLLGGATITTLRIGDPTYPLPVVLGMLAWGGLWMRDARLRALIPLLRSQEGS